MSIVLSLLPEPFYWNNIRSTQPSRLVTYSKSMFLSTP